MRNPPIMHPIFWAFRVIYSGRTRALLTSPHLKVVLRFVKIHWSILDIVLHSWLYSYFLEFWNFDSRVSMRKVHAHLPSKWFDFCDNRNLRPSMRCWRSFCSVRKFGKGAFLGSWSGFIFLWSRPYHFPTPTSSCKLIECSKIDLSNHILKFRHKTTIGPLHMFQHRHFCI